MTIFAEAIQQAVKNTEKVLCSMFWNDDRLRELHALWNENVPMEDLTIMYACGADNIHRYLGIARKRLGIKSTRINRRMKGKTNTWKKIGKQEEEFIMRHSDMALDCLAKKLGCCRQTIKKYRDKLLLDGNIPQRHKA